MAKELNEDKLKERLQVLENDIQKVSEQMVFKKIGKSQQRAIHQEHCFS